MSYLLGIDIGTSTIKAVLVDLESEGISQESFQPLGSQHENVTDISGAYERGVDGILTCLENCMKGLDVEKLEQVTGIGICGQMHGCVLWDNNINLFDGSASESQMCSNLITWQDARCTKEFLSSLPATLQKTAISTGYGCATLAWLQRYQSETVQKFNRAGTIMDLVSWALCTGDAGRNNPVSMSSQNAKSWGYFDVDRMDWESDILRSHGFPVHLLPNVVKVPSLIGSLQTSWNLIPQGTPVGVAMGDLQCSFLSTNPLPSDAILNVGSASQLGVIRLASNSDSELNSLVLPPSLIEVPYFNRDSLIVAASLTGANVLTTLVETIQGWMEELGIEKYNQPSESVLYERIIHQANQRFDTTLGINVTLWGERHDATLTGSVSNVKHGNLSLGDVSSAMLRGIVENLHAMMSQELLDCLKIKRLLGSGNALMKNHILQRHAEAVFNLPLEICDKSDAPLGAGLAIKKLL